MLKEEKNKMGIYGTRDGKFKVKKLVIQDKLPISYVIPASATVATGGIASGWDGEAGTAAGTEANGTVDKQPPYPLNIGITTNTTPETGTGYGTENTGRIRITGYDNLGNLRYEDVAIASTVGSTYYTNYSYARIDSVQPYNSSGALATTAADDIGIGWGNKAGLPSPIATSVDLLSYVIASSNATTAPTVTPKYNQVTISGEGALSKTVHIQYLSSLQ